MLGQPVLIVAVAVLADHVEEDGTILLADGLDIGQTFLDVDPRAIFLSQSLIDAGQMMIQGNVPRNTWFIPFFYEFFPLLIGFLLIPSHVSSGIHGPSSPRKKTAHEGRSK